jgi:hypothetical protein
MVGYIIYSSESKACTSLIKGKIYTAN